MMLTGLHIESDNQADLHFSRVSDRRGPGCSLPEHIINGFLIGKEDVTIKAFLARGEVIGAEALIARTTVNGE
jgi:hypothetical protein